MRSWRGTSIRCAAALATTSMIARTSCGRRAGDRLVVVGDTVRDITAALASEAVAIGVATGASTVEELEAAGATAVLPGLGDRDVALAAILGR